MSNQDRYFVYKIKIDDQSRALWSTVYTTVCRPYESFFEAFVAMNSTDYSDNQIIGVVSAIDSFDAKVKVADILDYVDYNDETECEIAVLRNDPLGYAQVVRVSDLHSAEAVEKKKRIDDLAKASDNRTGRFQFYVKSKFNIDEQKIKQSLKDELAPRKVYVVMSEVNGYRNVIGVAETESAAETFADSQIDRGVFDDVYIVSMNLID